MIETAKDRNRIEHIKKRAFETIVEIAQRQEQNWPHIAENEH